ncbi:hypothetical protein N7510_010118 [Penicillium lagena]|uniref:uncharacterized protein n=1 Tax=Penicillium lagena TaxID=94218 RepID=UPI00253F91EB|nr:uncharacterized protein N7510_010118 [Penicillium lagena]KAJ5604964.1 hypothetical protein N7510_010118 [Penicillium lagena]
MSKDALFSRIETLEAQLSAMSEDGSAPCTAENSPRYYSRENGQFSDVVDCMTLGHVVGNEPAHLGPSSGKMIATSLDLMMKDAVWMNALSDASSREQWHGRRSNASQQNRIAPPTDIAGVKFIQAYFGNLHQLLPFLDRVEIFQLHMKRNQLLAPNSTKRWEAFKLFIVYAIGSAMQKTPDRYNSAAPEDLFQIALNFKDPVMQSRSIRNIEGMMLLVIYNLRSTSSSTIWYLIGLAMRTAIDLGLHREINYFSLKYCEAQARRRMFWSVYILDRHIAWSLGRPVNIADHDIDVALPVNFEKPFQAAAADQLTSSEEESLTKSLGTFVPSIKLARLRSQIHNEIYRVDKNISLLLPMVPSFLSSLEDYERSLPSSLSQADNEWIHMHWNNGIRIILQPFLKELPPDHDLVRVCMRASGQMCQLFKKLRQKDYLGWGYILVNFMFMAGLTMCYCLLRCPRLWSITIANDLRACSSILYDVADRSQCVKKYRDLWEAIITNVMETLGKVSGQSGLAIDGDHQRIGWVDDIAIENPRTPADLYDSAILSHSCHEGRSPDYTFSDYISHDINLVDDTQLDPEEILRDIEDCSTELEGTVRNQSQLNGREYLAEVENILSEDFWAGDIFGSQMLSELVPKGSGGSFTFDTPPSQAFANYQS